MPFEYSASTGLSVFKCPTPVWLNKDETREAGDFITGSLNLRIKSGANRYVPAPRYACDKDSSLTLLNWLKPFEDFAYRFDGDIHGLKQAEKLNKSIIGRSDFAHSDRIIDRMVLLIREELHHFCQVLEIMQARGIPYENISASRYAKTLIQNCKTHEPQILIR